MSSPVMNTRFYAKVSGIALAAIAVLGTVWMFVGKETMDGTTGTGSHDLVKGFLAFDWTHNIVHFVLAAVALYVGFGNVAGNLTKLYAQVFGVVYLGLGVFGFVAANGLSSIGLHLELGENLVHVLIGAWGCLTGFFGTTTSTGTGSSSTSSN